ncbi:Deoxyribose-phosphate aldolase [Acidibacillus sp. S0AB]|uniref:Deoxyribose-phosphate aldolase n=2 Tax=Sulfoacidibacillus ferrooxidans TaxID=2005001 RepID=A0A9X1V647_9BACL|nr:Deoxyribose-phosphate aldolase [Sulfoacidibacillus ferrooxidans]
MTTFVRVAGGLVYQLIDGEPQVLIIEDRFGHVSLPKGHVEEDELLEETALREIEEETGVVGRIISPIGTVSYSFAYEGQDINKTAYYYLVEAIAGEIIPQVEEIVQARFVSLDEARRLMTEKGYENNRAVVEAGLNMVEQEALSGTLLASMIDSTLLAPTATPEEIVRLCREARTYQFASVCINPLFVRLAAEILGGSPVKVCTVIGFPLGATKTEIKVAEALRAVAEGAEELDMVIAMGYLKANDLPRVEADIRAVVDVAGDRALVKVILETCLLSPSEIKDAAQAAIRAGAQFVKTSTGFASGGATVEAVRTMRETVGDRLGVKAAGGIRTRQTADEMIVAGASRIGTSSGAKLVISALSLGF